MYLFQGYPHYGVCIGPQFLLNVLQDLISDGDGEVSGDADTLGCVIGLCRLATGHVGGTL